MTNLQASIEGLNPQQREAVLTTEGPVLIAAGAGSGKTRVLTHRIAYLIQERGVNPWNILAITFTNKAAAEMKSRVQQIVGDQADQIWVATFHAMCARILRREACHIGYNQNFSIVDASDQQTMMKQIMKDLNLDSDKYSYKSALAYIETAKNDGTSVEVAQEQASNYVETMYAKAYDMYQKRLKAANAMDFNDLILLTVQLLRDNQAIRHFYQQKFQYIHVDEYQDTNQGQYELVHLLSGLLRNVCVVGDADQSIYGWRGANMENILNFEKDFPDAKVILLEQNYRSTQTILNAANSVIRNNSKRNDKVLWSDNAVGDPVSLYIANDDRSEARFVIQTIHQIKSDQALKNRDFAVLYRTQAQSRSLEEALLNANLPYKVVGGLKFYARKEIQDTLAYLRLIDNPKDNLSFNRIVNVPKRGIGPSSVEKLASHADQLDMSYFEAVFAAQGSTISKAGQTKLLDFAHTIQKLRQQSEFLGIQEMMEQVWQLTGYKQALINEGSIEAHTRLENLEEFLSVAKAFDENPMAGQEALDPDLDQGDQVADIPLLTRFLTSISLVSDKEETDEDDQVTLMTLHAAKGLEYPYVFIVGMEEGLFPLSRAMENEEELEEERRLAYVGITRAEKGLYLTGASQRLLYGRTQYNPRSRFIDEIDSQYIKVVGGQISQLDYRPRIQPGAGYRSSPIHQAHQDKGRAKYSASDAVKSANLTVLSKQRPIFDKKKTGEDNDNAFAAGDKVAHRVWGQGTIVAVTPDKGDYKLSIAFPNMGVKTLMASLAPIEKL